MAQQEENSQTRSARFRSKYAECSFKEPSAEHVPARVGWPRSSFVLAGFGRATGCVQGSWSHWIIPIMAVTILVAVYVLLALKVARQWDRAVVLRLGKFHRLKGPGMFFIIPIVESIAQIVDMRIRATDFSSESTLTKDTVPVNVDAICFWMVWDAKKAVLEVAELLPGHRAVGPDGPAGHHRHARAGRHAHPSRRAGPPAARDPR